MPEPEIDKQPEDDPGGMARPTGDRIPTQQGDEAAPPGLSSPNLDAWFAEMDRFGDFPFMEGGREQPPFPEPEDIFE